MDLKSKIIDEEFSDGMLAKLHPSEMDFIKQAMDRYVRELIPTKEEIYRVRSTYSYTKISPLFSDGFRFGAKETIKMIEEGVVK